MKNRRFLIGGIAFLIAQAIIIFVGHGFPQLGADAYSFGFLVGYCATGIIGLIFLVVYFVKKSKTQ